MTKQYRVGDDILVKGIVNSEVSNGGIHVLHDGIDAFYSLAQIHEPQKPVIPQFVAEWIESSKASCFYLDLAMGHWNMGEKMEKWMQYSENQETFARAWLDGYTVEQEQLYTVEIPNPNSISLRRTFLGKVANTGKIQLRDLKEPNELCKLTEKEIKKDFEWAWQFAKPVEI